MRHLWLLIALVLASLTGCGGNDGGGDSPGDAGTSPGDAGVSADEYEAELFEHTRVLDNGALSALERQDENLTLTFAGSPAALAGIRRGSVLVGGQSSALPSGLLRLVTKVEEQSGKTIVSTMHAPLQLAFKKLHVRSEREIQASPVRTDLQPNKGGAFPESDVDFYAFNGDGDPSTKDDQVHVTGHFAAGFNYLLGIDVDWGELDAKVGDAVSCVLSLFSDCDPEELLPEVKVGFEAKAGADASLALEGVAFLSFQKELSLGSVKLDPIVIGPLVFVPTIDVRAVIEGEASSRFSLETSAKAGAEAALTFSSKDGGKLVPPTVTAPTFMAPNVDATLGAYGKVKVGPRLHLRLYDLFGPYASFYAFASLSADVAKDPCYELRGGLEGDVGIELVIDTPVYQLTLGDFEEPFGLVEKTITTGMCEIPPGGVPAVDQAFATPTFTPWSNAYPNTLRGFPFEGPGAQVEFTRLLQTIDGHVLVSGTAMDSLLKVRDDGRVVWARRYVLPEDFDPGLSSYHLALENVVPTSDAGLLVSGYPFTLLSIDQSGSLRWAKAFTAEPNEAYIRFTGLTQTQDGNFIALANYIAEDAEKTTSDLWMMKVDANGAVLWSRRVGDVDRGEVGRAIVAVDNDVVVVGSQWDGTRSFWRGFSLRVDGEGNVVWSTRLDFQEDKLEERTHLVTVRRARDGDLLIGGMADGVGPGEAMVVLKQKPGDGSLSFFNVETTRDGYLGMALTDLYELPTSGMVAVGNFQRIGRDLWMAGLDGIGKVQWLRRYGQVVVAATPEAEEADNPGLLVRDDGSALVFGYAQSLAQQGAAGVWGLKVPAKDGAISFSASDVTSSVLSHEVLPVTLTLAAWNPPASSLSVPAAPVMLEVKNVDATPRALSP